MRAMTGRTIEMTPAAGRKMMYTSGWPNSQKRCCHSRLSPPCSAWKKGMSKARSSSRISEPRIIGGKAVRIITATTSMYHAKIGSLSSDMPTAR